MFQIIPDSLPLSEGLPYFWRKIAYNNIDCPELYPNLKKTWRRWEMITRVLAKT